MGNYKIVLARNAKDDIEEIWKYISETLKEADTANKYVNTIRKSIQSLDEMPLRYNVIDDEPFKSMQMRRMIVKNFYIYYSVEKEKRIVNVHGVIYARRDQYSVLEK